MSQVVIQGDYVIATGATLHYDDALCFEGAPLEAWLVFGPRSVEEAFELKLKRYLPDEMLRWKRSPLDQRVLRRIADYEIEESHWDAILIQENAVHHLRCRSYRKATLQVIPRPYPDTYTVRHNVRPHNACRVVHHLSRATP